MKKIICLLCVIAAFISLSADNFSFAEEAVETTVVLDSCDTSDNNLVTHNVDRSNFVEGTGSWYANNEAGRQTALLRDLDASLLPDFDKAYLEFYYYVYDATNILGGQIELTSSGFEDVEELHFDVNPKTVTLTDGWNFVSIKLTDFENDGTFDYRKLCYFRFYMGPSKKSTFECNIDGIVITDKGHLDEVKENGITAKSTKVEKLSKITSRTLKRKDEAGCGAVKSVTVSSIILLITGALIAAGGTYAWFVKKK